MIENLVKLEQIRAELTNETMADVEAKKHLDALAWWLGERESAQQQLPLEEKLNTL